MNNVVTIELTFDREVWADLTEDERRQWIDEAVDSASAYAQVSAVFHGRPRMGY